LESKELRNYLKEINDELSRLIEKKGGSYFTSKHTKIFEEKPKEL
jgi:hypothetical protein